MKIHSLKTRSERGGVLITALLLTIGISVVLASHLAMSRTALRFSNRSFYVSAAVGVAETGVEHALWALNAANKGQTGAWDGWTIASGNASRKFTGFTLGKGAGGVVNVTVTGYQSEAPVILAKAAINTGSGAPVEKWLRVTASNGTTSTVVNRSRSLFAYGLLARESLYADGGAWMDSWQSDPDNDPATPPVPWSAAVARDNARIAVASTANAAMWINGADVYGTASVGSSTSSGLKMKDWDGQIGPRGTTWSGSYRVATGALSMDFTASYETIEAPAGATVVPSYTLPYNKSVVVSNQWSSWTENVYVSQEAIGTTGQPTLLQMNKFTVEGAATVTIKGDVTLVLPPSGVETFKVTASGKVLLESGATLTIYTPGNIDVSGAGITNSGAPKNVQIWSTSNGATGQKISLQGSGALNAILYAPDAEFTLPGHTDFSGAAVVRIAKLTGSGAFHYDESLEHFTGKAQNDLGDVSGGAPNVVGIEEYIELTTPEDRSGYLALLNF